MLARELAFLLEKQPDMEVGLSQEKLPSGAVVTTVTIFGDIFKEEKKYGFFNS